MTSPTGLWGLRAIVELRRRLLARNSPAGFSYRLLALSDTKVTVGGVVAAIDAEPAS